MSSEAHPLPLLLQPAAAARAPQACGVAASIVPLVSFRGFSAVTATVAAGGHVGAAVLQGAFFDRKE